jgi:hypothetical protein
MVFNNTNHVESIHARNGFSRTCMPPSPPRHTEKRKPQNSSSKFQINFKRQISNLSYHLSFDGCLELGA